MLNSRLEIIRAFELCILADNNSFACDDCPYKDADREKPTPCYDILRNDALELMKKYEEERMLGGTVTLNYHNYVTDEEIRKLCLDVIANKLGQQIKCEADAERVLSNLTSEYIFNWVSNAINGDHDVVKKAIADGVKEAIEGNHIKYQVFRRADAWERSESPAVKILDEMLSNSREKIEAEVNRRIEQYDFKELRDEIEDTIYGVICQKLREE